jgi:Raf kinase inhibitor-like YbhB/YbcL family protein
MAYTNEIENNGFHTGIDIMKKNEILLFIIAIIIGFLTYFILGNTSMNKTITLSSNAFTDGSSIPAEYTCGGENISPQLRWSGLSSDEVNSYALIVDDPDAKSVVGRTYVHWIALLPPTTTELPKGISGNGKNLASPAKELTNDFGNTYYGGPCPPHGIHTYRFTLFALNVPIESIHLKTPCTAEAFEHAMSNAIITKTVLTGTYTRS